MPTGTYNAMSRSGNIVRDPAHAVRLEGSDEWLGGWLGGQSVESIADYLLHRTRGVTLGELTAYYEDNGHPDIVAEVDTDDGTETRRYTWDESEGDYALVDQ